MTRVEPKLRLGAVLIAGVIVGMLAYTLPLYAGDQSEYHVEEKTVIEIPIVGEITCLTNSYLAGCQLRETTQIRIHNPIIKSMTDNAGKASESRLSDLCDQIQWKYDAETNRYVSHTFAELREMERKKLNADNAQIDMDSDQNDIADDPSVDRSILPGEKNKNGYSCRLVETLVYSDDIDNPIVIHEYYSDEAKALNKITRARQDLFDQLGYEDDHVDGLSGLIKQVYESVLSDGEWVRPDGEIVSFEIQMIDKDRDPLVTIRHNVKVAEIIPYTADHFTLN